MAADVEGDVYVLVEHPFEYTGKDGRRVAIQPNERYRLLRRSTEHWWHVRSEPGGRPFYLPAQYVRELPALGHPAPAPPPPAPLQGPAAPEPLAYDYRFMSAGGGFKACSVAGSWVCPRPLARSDSENVYEAIQDVRDPPTEQRPEQQVDEPPEPVYVNVERQPPATLPRASAAPRGAGDSVWETHTDAGTGRPYYYNPDTGVTTWESPFEATEGAASPATSPASVGSHESLETEWGQYWDEESHRVAFDPVPLSSGELGWGASPGPKGRGARNSGSENFWLFCSLQPPTPETDYPDLLTSYPEEDYSPVGSFSEPGPASPFVTPPGWSCHVSPDGQTVYTNNITEEQWVRLENQHGKTYFYNPDDASVQWALPQVTNWGKERFSGDSDPTCEELLAERESGSPLNYLLLRPLFLKIKTLDKAGVLHRTKIVDKGKRLRKKHWSASWTVLEGGILTFFKDSKNSAAGGLRQPSKLSTPEFTVDLKGASLTWAPKDKSSKKNVLELRSRDGSEYLIQHDSEAIISTWHSAITQGIQEMSADLPPEEESENSGVDFRSSERLGSWQEDEPRPGAAPSTPGPGGLEGDVSKVRQKLLRFLLRRPTLQSLREKGYIKDQVFGCPLAELCEREKSSVPRFVQQSIRAVEARGLDIDGLYRISGNLATIQKLRYKVDHDERLDLEDGHWEDVHVITGALKLFFRELPEPLFPFSHFRQFLAAIKLQDPATRFRCVRDLVRSLPAPNHDTLRVLFQHLCRVIEHGERNRMSVQNVAIVFGPTLLRPETEEASMPMTMVFQNQVVELILQQCSDIFPPH
ncbi:hypothetical protein E5288_WYG007676 [Bos mutus]|uniref:Rho GTPase-activating protein 27 n=1 Tax=Bos mutus TaxID=72004 RepID=A0A6B0RGY5_9CETA|nr:hypothetical protein [Bos mutus]